MSEERVELTRKYWVRPGPQGWRVDCADACVGRFSDPVEAVESACRQARADALQGLTATVTALTNPQELHCFTPGNGVRTAAETRTRPAYLRLVSG